MDTVKIEASNAYGDSFELYFENPSCEALIRKAKEVAQLLGFSPIQLYNALLGVAESTKTEIFKQIMYNLRIELAPNVSCIISLGNSYLKVTDIENCDPGMQLGKDFHDVLANLYDVSQDFLGNVVIFRNSDFTDSINFEDIFKCSIPNSFKCWVMNDTGDTLETFIIKNILDKDEEIQQATVKVLPS